MKPTTFFLFLPLSMSLPPSFSPLPLSISLVHQHPVTMKAHLSLNVSSPCSCIPPLLYSVLRRKRCFSPSWQASFAPFRVPSPPGHIFDISSRPQPPTPFLGQPPPLPLPIVIHHQEVNVAICRHQLPPVYYTPSHSTFGSSPRCPLTKKSSSTSFAIRCPWSCRDLPWNNHLSAPPPLRFIPTHFHSRYSFSPD